MWQVRRDVDPVIKGMSNVVQEMMKEDQYSGGRRKEKGYRFPCSLFLHSVFLHFSFDIRDSFFDIRYLSKAYLFPVLMEKG